MAQAYEAAQRTFKYFWRELSWERRRIVPGLDMSMVKLPFTDGPRTDGNPENEHMWIGEVEFDGETISGQLLNAPNWLTSVRQGDSVRVPFSHLEDWMMHVDGQAYGGFTVNAMRARMDRRQRKEHDDAWGLDFGDPAHVRVEIERDKPRGGLLSGLFGGRSKDPSAPDVFKEHPMCLNMIESVDATLAGDPSVVNTVYEPGLMLIHMEALAGNLAMVQLLIRHGADVDATTESGRTASELARNIGWAEIADYLDGLPRA